MTQPWYSDFVYRNMLSINDTHNTHGTDGIFLQQVTIYNVIYSMTPVLVTGNHYIILLQQVTIYSVIYSIAPVLVTGNPSYNILLQQVTIYNVVYSITPYLKMVQTQIIINKHYKIM